MTIGQTSATFLQADRCDRSAQVCDPASFGTVTAVAGGVLFESRYGDLGQTARYLVALNLPFVVREPPELRAALLELAQHLVPSATVGAGG